MKHLSRRTIITVVIAVCIVAVIVLAVIWQGIRTYDSYDIEKSFDIEGAERQQFEAFAGGFVAYTRDGAQYYDDEGLTVWNESYNMQYPEVEHCGQRLLVYDRQGSTIVVMSQEKELSVISTNHTIVRASIASDGTVAVLTQEGETGYINLYTDDGKSVAAGQVHMAQTGYPMSIALSQDGSRLIVSFAYASMTSLSTRINIYDFSSAGDSHKDNIIASYEYDGVISPQTVFFTDGCSAALCDDGIRIFSSGSRIKENTTIRVDFDIESVVTGDRYIGLIHRDDQNRRILTVYSEDGKKAFARKLGSSFSNCSSVSSDLIMIKSGRKIEIVDISGKTRFSYRFPDAVIAFLQTDDPETYFLIQRDSSQIIRLS